MEHLRNLLVRLRLVDAHDGNASITSALLALSGGVAAAAPSWPSVVVLLIAASLYAHKRHLNRSEALRDGTLKKLAEDVASMAQELTSTSSATKDHRDRLVRVENVTINRGR